MMGLRIGMTLQEARTIFKSRVLVSDPFLKRYFEIPRKLAFTVQNTSTSVPNSNYTSSLEVNTAQELDNSVHDFSVTLSPIPGQERIVAVARKDMLSRDKMPTFDIFEKTLLEKYGTPTYSSPTNNVFVWSYDSNGMLQKPGFIKDLNQLGSCPDAGLRFTQSDDWVLTLPTVVNSLALQLEQLASRCGSILVRATINFGSKYSGPDTLIRGYGMTMTGFDAGVRAFEAAKTIVDGARSDAIAEATKKGQQQKPEF